MRFKTKLILKWSLAVAFILVGVLGLIGVYAVKKLNRLELEDMAKAVHSDFKRKTVLVNRAYQIDPALYKAKTFPVEIWTDSITRLLKQVNYKPKTNPKYSQAIFRGLTSDSIPDYGDAVVFQILNIRFSESDSTYFHGDQGSFIKWEIGKERILESKICGDSVSIILWKKK
jgi:hypothetical protein